MSAFNVENEELQVLFDGKKVNGKLINSNLASKSISFSWIPDSFLKTFIIYDQDAPYPPPDNDKAPYIHMLAINVEDEIKSNNIIFDYLPPNPPVDSPAHTYYVEMYRQKGEMTSRKKSKREKFKLFKFINDHKLKRVARVYFKVSNNLDTKKSTHISYPENGITFLFDSDITEKQQKYCSCVIKVAEKQPASCNMEKAWFEKRDESTCYNPYAVCAKSVGTSFRNCSKYYDFDQMSDRYLIAYANLHGKKVEFPYSRSKLLKLIHSSIQ